VRCPSALSVGEVLGLRDLPGVQGAADARAQRRVAREAEGLAVEGAPVGGGTVATRGRWLVTPELAQWIAEGEAAAAKAAVERKAKRPAKADTEALAAVCDSIDLPVKAIKAQVATHFNVRLDWMASTRRWPSAARPRMVAMFLCRRLLALSYPEIGRAFGRHHTTVMHAVATMAEAFDRDAKVWRDVTTIERQLLVLAGRLQP
jgi:Bacterial dnaA protein helix-turn-helix